MGKVASNSKISAPPERLDSILNALDEVVFSVDPRTRELLYLNSAAEKLYSRPLQDFRDDPNLWLQFVHPEDRPMAASLHREILATGRGNREYRILKDDGSIRWVHVRGHAIRDAGEKIIRIDGIEIDITERRNTANALRESERRFSAMMGNVQLISVMLDGDGCITYCNDFLLRMAGWTREQIIGRNWFDTFIPRDVEDISEFFKSLLADSPKSWHHENEILTRSGGRRMIRWSNSVLRATSGEVIGTASIGEDITERKAQEIRIQRLNRTQRTLSAINKLIVRARDRQELFQETCRIAVELGGFTMVWIGMLSPDGGLKPIAVHGHEGGYLEKIKGALAAAHPGPSTLAIARAHPYICNDAMADPLMEPWREAAVQAGFRSVAALPLCTGKRVVGCLTLYSSEPEFFDTEEQKLLDELCDDISYALEFIARDEKLDFLAFYDPVTRLANRRLFTERLTDFLQKARQGRTELALVKIDLIRFQTVNEALGHAGGDEVLRALAEILVGCSNGPQFVARLDGECFGLIVPDTGAVPDLITMLNARLLPQMSRPMHICGREVSISPRLGIAGFPADAEDAESLLRNAEAALKAAKSAGERHLLYCHGMSEADSEQLGIESKLRNALARDEFVLHYQPKVNLRNGAISGVEALIRWNHPDLGLVPPSRFVPMLEDSGLILEVGRWALRQAAIDHRRWAAQGLPAPRIAVNVSALQLRQPDFVQTVLEAIGKFSGESPGIELEVTESMLMTDIESTIGKLQTLRDMGLPLAIDDFGTGYSSLAYLAKLPVSTVKIDRSFIVTMTDSSDTMTIISTILSLAHSLNLNVVAEGVDSAEQLKFLRLLKCDEIQGFLFSPGVPEAEFSEMLRQDRRLQMT